MKIKKYIKTSKSKYKLILEDDTSIILYDDVILSNQLLIKKEIIDIDKILECNKEYSINEVAIKYLGTKLRSIKEMKEYLLKQEFRENDIERVIGNLIESNLLNDKMYAKSYINDRFKLSNDGINKIINYLELNNIHYNDYSEYLDIFDEVEIYNRIEKYIKKNLKSNNKSTYLFKVKMRNNLINLGYNLEDINNVLNNIDINDKDNYNKEKAKIIKKLSLKYSGDELDKRVKEKLYRMGFYE